jgi:protein-L-isoaspartate(D-aspartate) O-methyltransferase
VNPPEPPRGAADAAAAMAAVPRSDFLPRSQRRYAALDLALPIAARQTCSQPSTVRTMLDHLDVRPGHRVLDVGAGSGWTTALLAWLVGPGGTVLGVELEPSLARWGGRNVAAAGMPWARVEQAVPGVLGRPQEAPYDRILVSAEAHTVPAELERQLTEGGVMVLPVSGRLLRLRAPSPGVPREVLGLGPYLFVPLR